MTGTPRTSFRNACDKPWNPFPKSPRTPIGHGALTAVVVTLLASIHATRGRIRASRDHNAFVEDSSHADPSLHPARPGRRQRACRCCRYRPDPATTSADACTTGASEPASQTTGATGTATARGASDAASGGNCPGTNHLASAR